MSTIEPPDITSKEFKETADFVDSLWNHEDDAIRNKFREVVFVAYGAALAKANLYAKQQKQASLLNNKRSLSHG